MRKAILLKGQSDDISKSKQELCKAQVLWAELGDAHCEVKEIVRDEDVPRVEGIWEQVSAEWSLFNESMKDEIACLENQNKLESSSTSSKSIARKQSTGGSSVLSLARSAKSDKYALLKEEAALKVKLAFAEQESELMIAKLQHEKMLERLKLKQELEESKAKLSVCIKTESEEIPSFDLADLKSLPKVDMIENVNKFLDALAPPFVPESCEDPDKVLGKLPPVSATSPPPELPLEILDPACQVPAQTQPPATPTQSFESQNPNKVSKTQYTPVFAPAVSPELPTPTPHENSGCMTKLSPVISGTNSCCDNSRNSRMNIRT